MNSSRCDKCGRPAPSPAKIAVLNKKQRFRVCGKCAMKLAKYVGFEIEQESVDA